MKKLYTIVLISLLVTFGRGGPCTEPLERFGCHICRFCVYGLRRNFSAGPITFFGALRIEG